MAYQYKVRLHFRFVGYRPVQAMVLLGNAIWVFAQYGVKLELASIQGLSGWTDETALGSTVPLPKTPDYSKYYVYQWLTNRIGPVDGIPVVFVPDHIERAQGMTLPWQDRVLILISSQTTVWTLAHELGHALADQVEHDIPRDHVMHPTVDIRLPRPMSTPIFTPDQLQRIYRSPFCVPC